MFVPSRCLPGDVAVVIVMRLLCWGNLALTTGCAKLSLYDGPVMVLFHQID